MNEMRILLLGVLWACCVFQTQGLNCWVCENEGSNAECERNGRLQQCLANEGACQNEMRRNDGRLQITKRCKQALACDNNFVQNERAAWFPSQCNIDAPNTHCKCCCNFDLCNKRQLQCLEYVQCPALVPPVNGWVNCTDGNVLDSECTFNCREGYQIVGSKRTTCVDDSIDDNSGIWTHPTPVCQLLEPECDHLLLSRGSFECTDGFRIGSTCYVTCSSGQLYPPSSDNITCGNPLIPAHLQPHPRWSIPPERWNVSTPCCVDQCPPHAHMDACIVLDSTNSVGGENWEIMTNFAVRMIQSFDVDSGSTRFSVFRFGTFPHSRSQILFNQFVRDSEGLVAAVQKLDWLRAGSTFIGRALTHANTTMFNHANGDRSSAPNVLFIITDGRSHDNVEVISQVLRDRGVKIFVIAVTPKHGKADQKQLMQIAGEESRIFSTTLGFDDLRDTVLANRVTFEICGNPCETIHCHPIHVAPANGQLSCTNGDLLNSTCTFTCDEGYDMYGSDFSTCLDDGNGDNEGVWSHPAPKCRMFGPICNDLEVRNGGFQCTDGFNYDSTCEIQCDVGTPYPPSVKCQDMTLSSATPRWDLSGLRWNISEPCCGSAQCPPNALVDIALVLDSSFSVQEDNWEIMVEFAIGIIQTFNMGPSGARFSVLSFGIEVDTSFEVLFNTYTDDKQALLEAVSVIPYQAADGTYIGNALSYARDVVFKPQNGDRPNVKNILVVITDGISADPVVNVSKEIRQLGVKTFAVGVESPFGKLFNEDQLLEIAGSPDRLLTAKEGFRQLARSAFVAEIENEICGHPCREIFCNPAHKAPTNGGVSCTDGNSLGSVCNFVCDKGYVMDGEPISTCMDGFDGFTDGVWSSLAPTCVEPHIPCDSLVVVNGDYECNDEFRLGSGCEIQCETGEPYPPMNDNVLFCGNSSDPKLRPQWSVPPNRWNVEEPCCSLPCPPHAYMDAVIILDSSYSVHKENWKIMKNFAKSIIDSFDLESGVTRFSVFSYGMFTDDATQVLLNDYVKDKWGLLDAIDKMEWLQSDGTFTGRALRHAREVIFQEANGDRPHVDNVLIVVTDGQSCDDIEKISEELRYDGVKTLAVGVYPPKGKDFNRGQLLTIAGDESRLFIPKAGFEDLTLTFFRETMSEEICGNPCEQISCGDAPAPKNSVTNCTHGNFEGSECSFECLEGFKLKGNKTSTCDGDDKKSGSWNHKPPVCLNIVAPCSDLVIQGGIPDCTDEFFLDSRCEVTCERGRLYPRLSDTIKCVNMTELHRSKYNQPQWDIPRNRMNIQRPCCIESCPPRDVSFILDSSSSVRLHNWNTIKNFTKRIIQDADMDLDQTRFSVISYGSYFDEEAQILLGDYIANKQGLIDAIDKLEWLESDGTVTGKAMQHALDVVFKQENGDRPQVGNVLVVITDGVSCDQVESVSEELRARGVMTYAFGVNPPHGPPMNETQLMMIAGSADRLFMPDAGFEDLGTEIYSTSMNEEICGNPCEEVKCNPPHVAPTNGEMACSFDNLIHSVCIFECYPGYELKGSDSSTCVDDKDGDSEGVWTSSTPLCVPKGESCEELSVLNGDLECSDKFNFRSHCEILCPTGEPYPSMRDNITTCGSTSLTQAEQPKPKWTIPDNKWKVTRPCCAELCPPHAFMDACFVLDSTFSVGLENWNTMKNFTKRIISAFDMLGDVARFSVFNYGTAQTNFSEIRFNDFIGDKPGLLHALDEFQWLKADGTNTSNALRHARENIFTRASGDRQNVSNLLIVITDGRSDDSVDEVARSLRKMGVKTFALGVHPPTFGTPLNRTELSIIAGSEDRLFIPTSGFASLTQVFADQISEEICGNPCERISCPVIEHAANGEFICSRGNALMSICVFTCDEGYELQGSKSTICNEDFDVEGSGRWSNPFPTCEPIVHAIFVGEGSGGSDVRKVAP